GCCGCWRRRAATRADVSKHTFISNAGDMATAPLALTLDETCQIPDGGRNFAGANEKSFFFDESAWRGHRPKRNAIGFDRKFEFLPRTQRKTLANNFWNNQ